MSKEYFILWNRPSWTDEKGKPVVGGKPAYTKTFKHGNDIWEVWVFEIYHIGEFDAYFDHSEHIAFKNGYVEEWGTGELPITIRQNPNQFQYDININEK